MRFIGALTFPEPPSVTVLDQKSIRRQQLRHLWCVLWHAHAVGILPWLPSYRFFCGHWGSQADRMKPHVLLYPQYCRRTSILISDVFCMGDLDLSVSPSPEKDLYLYFLLLFSLCVNDVEHGPHRGPLCGITYLLPPLCWLQRSNLESVFHAKNLTGWAILPPPNVFCW